MERRSGGGPSLPPFPADRPSPSAAVTSAPHVACAAAGNGFLKVLHERNCPRGARIRPSAKFPSQRGRCDGQLARRSNFPQDMDGISWALPPSGSLDVAREAECLGITTNLMGGGRYGREREGGKGGGRRREAYRKHFLWAANRCVVIPAQLRWSRRRRRPK